MVEAITGQPVSRIFFHVPTNASIRTLFGRCPDGGLVHAADPECRSGHSTCPDCGEQLEPGVSEEGFACFHHMNGIECNSAGTAALLAYAREIFAARIGAFVPPVMGAGPAGMEQIWEGALIRFDRVEIVQLDPGLRPNLVGTFYSRHRSELETRHVAIEISTSTDSEPEKIEHYRSEDISMMRIDLTGLQVGLGQVELSEQLMRGAPRGWDFHRIARMWEEEVWRDVRRKQNSLVSRGRYSATNPSPGKHNRVEPLPEDRGWIEDETAKWSIAGIREIFADRSQDDVFFAAGPLAWRLRALSCIAPWHESCPTIPLDLGVEHAALAIAIEMEKAGLLTAAAETGNAADVDRAAGAIAAFLNSTLDARSGRARSAEPGRELEAARNIFLSVWANHGRFATLLEEIADLLSEIAIEVHLYGHRVSTREDVVHALAARPDSLSIELCLRVALHLKHLATHGENYLGNKLSDRALMQRGITLHPKEEHPTASGVEAIETHFRALWRKDLDQWLDARAEYMVSVFEKLAARIPDLRRIVRRLAVGYVFDRRKLASFLDLPMMLDAADPLAETRAAIEEQISVLRDVALRLERVISLSEATRSECVQRWIRNEGASICLCSSLGTDARSVRGLVSPEGLSSGVEILGRIETVARKWRDSELFIALLGSRPPGAGETMMEMIFGGSRSAALKWTRELEERGHVPAWVE